jgi:hypothetical protein
MATGPMNRKAGPNFGLGIAIGACMGTLLSLALHNPGLWIGVGVALGVAFASAFHGRRS